MPTMRGSTATTRVAERTDALAALYEAHVDEVRRYVSRRCRDSELAEDVTQDVFLAVARSGEDPADLGIGWLVHSARNRLIDLLRRRERQAAHALSIRPALQCDAAGAVVDRVAAESALMTLSDDQREVLTLHYMQGFTVSQVAAHMGRTPKAVECLVTRARRNLRREIRLSGRPSGP